MKLQQKALEAKRTTQVVGPQSSCDLARGQVGVAEQLDCLRQAVEGKFLAMGHLLEGFTSHIEDVSSM
eukprot:6269668-Prorocentrum_lima.AAC.1